MDKNINDALDFAISALSKNPDFPIECWVSCGLEEPIRSQVWQRAKEVVAHEQLELKLEY